MIIFDADDPLVTSGTYDREGYKPGERARIAKAKATQEAGATSMAKKRKQPSKTARARRATPKKTTHRVTTHKPNGSPPESMEVAPDTTVSIGEAMRLAVDELGDITIDNALAPKQLRELADVYEDVARAQAAFNAKADAAKIAKKALESVTALLLEKVRSFTHPAPLPLFDQAHATADHDDMLTAGESSAKESTV